MDSGQLRVVLSGESNSRDSWQQGRDKITGPQSEARSFSLVGELSIGLGRGFEVAAVVPYAWARADDEGSEDDASGLGDMATRIYMYHQLGAYSLGASAGFYWPIGEAGNDALPASASFSSGTIDPAVGVSLSGPLWRSMQWNTSAEARLILDEKDGIRRGSSTTVSLGFAAPLSWKLQGVLSATYLHRETDEMTQEMPMHHLEDSGGDWVYLRPSVTMPVRVRPTSALQATIGIRIPVLQDVVGIQLVEDPAWHVGIGHTWQP